MIKIEYLWGLGPQIPASIILTKWSPPTTALLRHYMEIKTLWDRGVSGMQILMPPVVCASLWQPLPCEGELRSLYLCQVSYC